ncbi:MAG: nucleotidyl transferase AbiEii/AbiGii toxin family protein [Bacteroidales bacterium]
MSNWLEIEIGERRSSLSTISNDTGMDESSIEKDWWVTAVLKALFQSSCSAAINFKGGTSLSKGWNLITRFSEDIDIAIDKSFWDIKGETESQRDKLRKVSRKYIQEALCKELDTILREMGISGYTLEFMESTTSDADPSTINIHYNSIVEDRKSYIPPSVKVEISCRSLWEPCEVIEYKSFIASHFPKENFIDAPFKANTIYPTRTFLEKAFLLHEEFQKIKIRTMRMSRHLYDLEKMMDTKFAQEALGDIEMYNTIIQHRKDYTPIRGIDYSLHSPATINFIPPASVIDAYREDYRMMQEIFIYGESLAFEKLMERIEELNGRFKALTDK